ncbi:hypothetical protein MRX96_010637 [Rhipicephalus microplus]
MQMSAPDSQRLFPPAEKAAFRYLCRGSPDVLSPRGAAETKDRPQCPVPLAMQASHPSCPEVRKARRCRRQMVARQRCADPALWRVRRRASFGLRASAPGV